MRKKLANLWRCFPPCLSLYAFAARSSNVGRGRGGLPNYGTSDGSGPSATEAVLSPTTMAVAAATAAKEAHDMDEFAALASSSLEAQGYGHGRNARTANATRSRLFSMAPHLAADLDEVTIAKRVRSPTAIHFFSSVIKDAQSYWKSSFVCIVCVLLSSVACIGGLIGGMVDLQVQGQCGILAQKIVARTYTIKPLEGVDQYANVVIDNQWPRGSVEIDAKEIALGIGSFDVRLWGRGGGGAWAGFARLS
jgi:hypothetical protein